MQRLYSQLAVIRGNGGKQSLDILHKVCQDLVRFVQPEGASLEPGWPLCRFRGVFQQGVPLDARQAYWPNYSSQRAEAKPLQRSWPAELHRGQCRQIRGASHEAVPSLAGIAGFEIFTEPLGRPPGSRRVKDNRYTRSTPAFKQSY